MSDRAASPINLVFGWIAAVVGLLTVATVVFLFGAAWQDSVATKVDKNDLRTEMRAGFDKMNNKIDRWPLDSKKLDDVVDDLKQAKAKISEQAGQVRDLQEWTKADRSWLERLERAVQDLGARRNGPLPQGNTR